MEVICPPLDWKKVTFCSHFTYFTPKGWNLVLLEINNSGKPGYNNEIVSLPCNLYSLLVLYKKFYVQVSERYKFIKLIVNMPPCDTINYVIWLGGIGIKI